MFLEDKFYRIVENLKKKPRSFRYEAEGNYAERAVLYWGLQRFHKENKAFEEHPR